MTNFTDLQEKRRSIYALGKNVELSNQELVETIQGAILQTPSAFKNNSNFMLRTSQYGQNKHTEFHYMQHG